MSLVFLAVDGKDVPREIAILDDDIAREARDEAAEAARRGMTAEEWKDLKADLQLDADLQG
ncbi:MAG: hypothetical protein NT026_02510 [Candidatus Staskawiczbacteria bacterium]|nr:hypothetical protein [Candidatus Staskawiczbacteria bacterium]